MRPFLLLLAAVFLLPVTSAADDLPPFPDISLIGSGGETVPVRSLLGNATIVNFWATWCGPCRVELPELQRFQAEWSQRGLVVLAVNIDSPRALVPRFLERVGIALPSYFLDDATERSLGIAKVPTTVLINAEGQMVQLYEGYSRAAMDDMVQRVEALLAPNRGQGGS